MTASRSSTPLSSIPSLASPECWNLPASPTSTTSPPTGLWYVTGETAQQQFDQYAPYMCHCTTPVKPYNKNFQPRLGFAYAYTPSTVFAGGFGRQPHPRRRSRRRTREQPQARETMENLAHPPARQVETATADPAFYLNPALCPVRPERPVSSPQSRARRPLAVTGILGPNIPCVDGRHLQSLFCHAILDSTRRPAVNPLATTGNYNFTKLLRRPPERLHLQHRRQYLLQPPGRQLCRPLLWRARSAIHQLQLRHPEDDQQEGRLQHHLRRLADPLPARRLRPRLLRPTPYSPDYDQLSGNDRSPALCAACSSGCSHRAPAPFPTPSSPAPTQLSSRL